MNLCCIKCVMLRKNNNIKRKHKIGGNIILIHVVLIAVLKSLGLLI